MKRFNYLHESTESYYARLLHVIPLIETSARTRHAFLACAITAVLCSTLSLWENTELRIAQVNYIRSVAHLEQDESQINRLKPLSDALGRLGANARQIGEIRGKTVERLKIIAEIGDHLSARVWLMGLQEDGVSIHVRGRAFTTTDVGAALTSLSRLPGLEQPRLDHLTTISGQSSGPVDFDLIMKEKIN